MKEIVEIVRFELELGRNAIEKIEWNALRIHLGLKLR